MTAKDRRELQQRQQQNAQRITREEQRQVDAINRAASMPARSREMEAQAKQIGQGLAQRSVQARGQVSREQLGQQPSPSTPGKPGTDWMSQRGRSLSETSKSISREEAVKLVSKYSSRGMDNARSLEAEKSKAQVVEKYAHSRNQQRREPERGPER